MKVCVKFQAFKKFPQEAGKGEEIEKKMKKKSFGFGKKSFGPITNTKVGPWFQFGTLVVVYSIMKIESVSDFKSILLMLSTIFFNFVHFSYDFSQVWLRVSTISVDKMFSKTR